MRSQHKQIIRKKQPKGDEKPMSVNEILRASYRKFTRDRHTKAAMTLLLR